MTNSLASKLVKLKMAITKLTKRINNIIVKTLKNEASVMKKTKINMLDTIKFLGTILKNIVD